MVDNIYRLGVRDVRVLAAMQMVDRAKFVPEQYKDQAYEDRPLPIGQGQTISQPYTVARMLELLIEGTRQQAIGNRVLEIGTGSGYQTAILARLFGDVYSVEFIPELAKMAEFKISNLKFKNIKIKIGDGKGGWVEHAPYDGIISAADAMEIPDAWIEQLKLGGRLVTPVRGVMMRGTKIQSGKGTVMKWEEKGEFSFVPLV
jgi:protein-L-isoaspartate(D-aspartate) O-methyltransferase